MDRLQKSMNTYVKSLSRRGETFDDREKGLPVSYLGRTMIAHGEEFEADSEFGNCLIGTFWFLLGEREDDTIPRAHINDNRHDSNG